jgi:hypothetical protein
VAPHFFWRLGGLAALSLVSSSGCERGCARGWQQQLRGDPREGRIPSLEGTDCPDGLARCDEGTVRVSRLAVLPPHCTAPDGPCRCPWDAVAACHTGCVAEGVELVVESASASAQLCAPDHDSGALLTTAAPTAGPVPSCDEGDAFRCVAGDIVACSERRILARCARGCYLEGATLDSEPSLQREAVYALLCSR